MSFAFARSQPTQNPPHTLDTFGNRRDPQGKRRHVPCDSRVQTDDAYFVQIESIRRKRGSGRMSKYRGSQVRSMQLQYVIRQAHSAAFGSVQISMTRIKPLPDTSPRTLSKSYNVDVIQHRIEWRSRVPSSRHSAAPFEQASCPRNKTLPVIRDFASYSQLNTPPSHEICSASAGFCYQDVSQIPGVGQFVPEVAGLGRIKVECSQLCADDLASYVKPFPGAEERRELLLGADEPAAPVIAFHGLADDREHFAVETHKIKRDTFAGCPADRFIQCWSRRALQG
jgi:hypothetical protein